MEGTLDMKEQAIDNAIATIGTRMVHLRTLVPKDQFDSLDKFNTKENQFDSLDKFNTKVKVTEMKLRVSYSSSFRRMVHECPGAGFLGACNTASVRNHALKS